MKKLLTLVTFLACCQVNGFAQNTTRQSYEKAREILDKSLEAYGGLENLRAVQNFSIRVEGEDYHPNQSRRPDLVETTPLRVEVTLDLRNNGFRLYTERGNVGTDIGINYDVSADGKERTSVNVRNKTKQVRPVPPNFRQRFSGLLPQFVALSANERRASLRYLGTVAYDNRPHEVIAYQSADGTSYSLYIDAKNYLISKQESLVSSAFGDAIQETTFQSYKTVGKFKVQSESTTLTAGVKNYTWRYKEVSFDKTLTADDFKADSDLTARPMPPNEPPVQRLGDNIYAVRAGGYRVLAVNFKDYIFVMEAPTGDAASRDVIAKIKETMPGKPIKFLAVSHHHIDHSGGTRTYVAEGATLITTKGNGDFFERMIKSQPTIAPDTLLGNPKPLKMEFVENGKRTFTDGATTVELYNIGTGPHAEEMLVAYLPKEKILYQADLFDEPSGLRSKTTVQLVDWILFQKLPVETILPVHGTATSFDVFQKDAANFAKSKNQ